MSFRFRLSPTVEQEHGLLARCNDARTVWNIGVEQFEFAMRYRPYREGKRVGWPDAKERTHQLSEARAHGWLNGGARQVQDQALRDLDRAYQNWWDRPDHFRRPTFRRRGVDEGFNITGLARGCVKQVNTRWGTITVPKVGAVRFRLTRDFNIVTACRSARVVQDRAGRWHVSFAWPQPALARTGTGTAVGLDMGVAASITLSTGEQHRMPALLTAGQVQRQRRLQRKLSRQRKGSNRRARTKQQLAHCAARQADRRNDWIEQTTTRLVRDHDLIAIENLQVKNMVRSAKGTVRQPGSNVRQKAGLNRSIHSQAWGRTRQRLEQKAAAATVACVVVAVPAANTSRRCAVCGHVARENRENQTDFLCVACGHQANADVNAAINIRAAGLAVTGRGGTAHALRAQCPDETSTTLTVRQQ